MKNSDSRGKNLKWLEEQPMDYQLSLFHDYTEVMKIVANSLMKSSMEEKCGERYSREKPEDGRYNRWGYNRGSIKVGDEKLPIDVPRYYDEELSRAQNADVYGQIKDQVKGSNKKNNKLKIFGLNQRFKCLNV